MNSEKEIKVEGVPQIPSPDPTGSTGPVVPPTPEGEPPKQKRAPYWPLIVYLVLSGLGILSYLFNPNINILTLLMNIVWVIIFAVIIYELCKHNHMGLAWVMVFLPLIISVIFFILILFAVGASI